MASSRAVCADAAASGRHIRDQEAEVALPLAVQNGFLEFQAVPAFRTDDAVVRPRDLVVLAWRWLERGVAPLPEPAGIVLALGAEDDGADPVDRLETELVVQTFQVLSVGVGACPDHPVRAADRREHFGGKTYLAQFIRLEAAGIRHTLVDDGLDGLGMIG